MRHGGCPWRGPGARSPRALPSTAHCVTWPGRQGTSRRPREEPEAAAARTHHRRWGARAGHGVGRDARGEGEHGIRLSSHRNPPFAPHGASPAAQPRIDTESWNYLAWIKPPRCSRAPRGEGEWVVEQDTSPGTPFPWLPWPPLRFAATKSSQLRHTHSPKT